MSRPTTTAQLSPQPEHERVDAAAVAQSFAEQPTIPPKAADASGDTGKHPTTGRVPQFPKHVVLHEVARGGMGVVFKARQLQPDRVVALKMILAGQLASGEEVTRFHTEANAAANLDHPGIVPIFEVGEHDGQHYFTMAFVEGESLADRLKQGPLPARESAMLVQAVCQAVQHAHDKGIIHRDLKPANVLLETGDSFETRKNTLASGGFTLPYWPRITDFGLAKQLHSDSHLTSSGQVVGTPNYMPPEQASGKTQTVRETADIYSVGAILYACLTGRPPHQAATSLDTIMQVLDAEPAPPRLLNPLVPRELEAICLKCLKKEPSQRYASANQVADELQRFLDGDPIQASSSNVLDYMLHALRKDRHSENFREWGLGLMAFGLVIFAAHLATFVLEANGWRPLVAIWVPRSLMTVTLGLLLWRFRRQSLWPTNSAERLIWVVWIGYMICVGVLYATVSACRLEPNLCYAFSALLSGFGFLIMGVHVWGGAYLIGSVFLGSAPLLGMFPSLASLAFGLLWGAACLAFGMHYWWPARWQPANSLKEST